MNIAIVTSMNGIGLERDYLILHELLTRFGHNVDAIQYDRAAPERTFDLAIFLETIPRNMLQIAPIKWAFLNPEWCMPDVIQAVRANMDRVLAKTKEGFRIFREVFGDNGMYSQEKVVYVGYSCRDQYDKSIRRSSMFLHIGGNSQIRGTQSVIDAWKWKKDGKKIQAKLIVISRQVKLEEPLDNVEVHDHVDDATLKFMQNKCQFHLFPSGTEGYGHALHEAQSVGALIMTTDAPPMNELPFAYRVPSVAKHRYNLADIHAVSALDIYNGVTDMLIGPPFAHSSREDFLTEKQNFEAAMQLQLENVHKSSPAVITKRKGDGKHIAFLGNFQATESTENMIKWALEEGLGHDVMPVQENFANASAIKTAMDETDAFIWVRTPGWLQVTDRKMNELIQECPTPTASIHLDKFWGIPEREKLIGQHPFWKTDKVFTADGSRQAEFAERGVNHIWMRPAVSEVYCHPGQPWDMYRCDVGFVGAKDYHNEYPFRRQLVEFLEQNYKDRFQHITALRGHGLNDFYASCKVVVGDCIFAGTPHYWSDRVPETCGRYGFLVHPDVEGLNLPIAKYKPQDLDDLGTVIEECLAMSESRRKIIREDAAWFVQEDDTWTVRMMGILNELF